MMTDFAGIAGLLLAGQRVTHAPGSGEMPNKVDRIRRLRAALEAIAQGTEQPAAGQIAIEAIDTDNYLAENPQNVVDDQKEPKRQQ